MASWDLAQMNPRVIFCVHAKFYFCRSNGDADSKILYHSCNIYGTENGKI